MTRGALNRLCSVIYAILDEVIIPLLVKHVKRNDGFLFGFAWFTYTARGTVKTHFNHTNNSKHLNQVAINNLTIHSFCSTRNDQVRLFFPSLHLHPVLKYLCNPLQSDYTTTWNARAFIKARTLILLMANLTITRARVLGQHHSSLSFTDQTSMLPLPSPVPLFAHTGQKPGVGTRDRL
jgi:hypothetical protein